MSRPLGGLFVFRHNPGLTKGKQKGATWEGMGKSRDGASQEAMLKGSAGSRLTGTLLTLDHSDGRFTNMALLDRDFGGGHLELERGQNWAEVEDVGGDGFSSTSRRSTLGSSGPKTSPLR